MDKVTLAMPSVSSTNLLKNYSTGNVQQKESFTSDQKPAEEIISKEAADASKVYSRVVVNKKPVENKTLEAKKAELISQGKLEGKDFNVKYAGENFKTLEVIENDKTSEIFFYENKDDSDGKLETYTKYEYCLNPETTGLKKSLTGYDADGKFIFRSNVYEKEKSPYKNMKVNFDTKFDKFVEKLESENAKFVINHTEGNDTTTHSVSVLDNDRVLKYEFTHDINGEPLEVSVSEVGNDGYNKNVIAFGPEETVYTEFKDSLIY